MQGNCPTGPCVCELAGATVARVALFLAAATSAVTASAVELSGLLRLTTNYEYRGYTLSDDHAAAQANIDAAWPNGLFLGSWLSSADFGGASAVTNPYLGKLFTLSPDWQLITSVSGHWFNDKVNDSNASYGEGALRLDYRDIGSLQVNWSPDYYGTGESVPSYESELRYPLSDTVEVSGGLGYQASRDALDYDALYANVGIAWFIRPQLTLDLRYHDLHEMNERQEGQYGQYGQYGLYDTDPLSEYRVDTPVIFSVSLGF